ncbi:hypothetical protein [Niveibacterium terrae]|uniref:hypothetical protein n=1 Tax=Niveibacterium terrae TaxID=3373598 RepID=UPI003A8E415F
MPGTNLFLVQVVDSRHESEVMSAVTVAVSPREAARQVCSARFGKWTDADLVRVRSVSGKLSEDFAFGSVAPDD